MRISWKRNRAGDLVLTWCESGGPPVRRHRARAFGTTIIDRSVPYDLGGAATIEYKPTGVEAVFPHPGATACIGAQDLCRPRDPLPRPSAGHPQVPPHPDAQGHNLLLVEDSLIIALDAEDIAGRLGVDWRVDRRPRPRRRRWTSVDCKPALRSRCSTSISVTAPASSSPTG